ncbi:hypothetical protein OB966_22355 [Bacillus cereus]|nr:hypothetical protein [Bacillus cereus]
MPQVIIEGQYLGASMKTSNFDGNQKSFVQVDVYQPDSTDNEKTVPIKCEDVTIMNNFKDSKMGAPFKAKVSINAYQNRAYFKMLELLPN